MMLFLFWFVFGLACALGAVASAGRAMHVSEPAPDLFFRTPVHVDPRGHDGREEWRRLHYRLEIIKEVLHNTGGSAGLTQRRRRRTIANMNHVLGRQAVNLPAQRVVNKGESSNAR